MELVRFYEKSRTQPKHFTEYQLLVKRFLTRNLSAS